MTDYLEDIIDALFLYSSEQLVPLYLKKNANYRPHCKTASDKEVALKELLTPEGQKLLEEFKASTELYYYIEMKCQFQAGIAIGMNLAQLV